MAETAKVLVFPSRVRTGDNAEELPSVVTVSNTADERTGDAKQKTNIDELYSADVASTALIKNARQLLSKIDGRAARALELVQSGDMIGSDQEVMLLQSDLLGLFACRKVSEGLSAYVLALHYALYNRHGVPPDLNQLYAIRKSVQRLHSDLFITFSDALDLVDTLADAGMIVSPPETTLLSEAFSDGLPNQSAG